MMRLLLGLGILVSCPISNFVFANDLPKAILVNEQEALAVVNKQVAPSHVSSPQILEACLNATEDFDLSKIYSQNGADNQGNLGTCGAYAGVDSLELAWWRFNQSYQLNSSSYAPVATPVIPFLTEPIYYAVKSENYRRHDGILSQDMFKDAVELIEGVYVDDFTLLMVDMLKKGTLSLHLQRGNHANVCQAKGMSLLNNLRDLIKETDATPQGTILREKLNQEESSLNDADAYLAIKIKGKSLREHIQDSYKTYIKEATEGQTELKIRSDYFAQLGAYRVKLPQIQDPPQACDPNKLKETFLRYICGGIPISVATRVSTENSKIKVDASSEEQFGHAMLLSGFKAATPTSPFKFVLKNSHRNQQSVEVTPEELCPALYGASMVLNKGQQMGAITSDFTHLPAASNSMYSIEEGIYRDGLPVWGVAEKMDAPSVIENQEEAPDGQHLDKPAIRRPNKKNKNRPLKE